MSTSRRMIDSICSTRWSTRDCSDEDDFEDSFDADLEEEEELEVEARRRSTDDVQVCDGGRKEGKTREDEKDKEEGVQE